MEKQSIKRTRIILGKTQKEVADEIGVHVQTYAKIEHNPEIATISQAKRIAKALNTSIDKIFFLSINSTLSR